MDNFAVFLTASVILWVTPGQDTMYILARSIAQGRLAGVISALGIGTGGLTHAFLAVAGISVLILTSPVLFLIVKTVGGLYLVYLGVSAILSASTMREEREEKPAGLVAVYFQGVMTNILNPKVALFFIAFLPQFVDSKAATISLAVLGVTFVVGGTAWCLIISVFASSVSPFFVRSSKIQRWIGRISGAVYIGLGLKVLRAKV